MGRPALSAHGGQAQRRGTARAAAEPATHRRAAGGRSLHQAPGAPPGGQAAGAEGPPLHVSRGGAVQIDADDEASAALAAAFFDPSVTQVRFATLRVLGLFVNQITPSQSPLTRISNSAHHPPSPLKQVNVAAGAVLTMRPSLFRGHGIGRPNGLLRIGRNLNVTCGDPLDPAVINWSMMDATLLVEAGRVLTFEGVALSNIR